MSTFTGIACRFGIKAEDGLTMSREAIEQALPAYLKKGAPVHFAHGRSVIGKVLAADVSDAALTVKLQIDDPTVAEWATDGTTQALSIHFRFNRRQDVRNGVVLGCDLDEISVGDVPGCPHCYITHTN